MALSLENLPHTRKVKTKKNTKGPRLKPWQLPDATFVHDSSAYDMPILNLEIFDQHTLQAQVFHFIQDAAAATLSTQSLQELLTSGLSGLAKNSYYLSRLLQRGSHLLDARLKKPLRLPVPQFLVTEHKTP